MNMLAKKAKKGFTIVELVIVIAVIAILAAVLIPTFTSVINNANESAAMQESKNEWTNYLAEVAGDGTYTDYTYYAVNGDYVFEVKGGEFNTTPVTGVSYYGINVTSTTEGADYVYTSSSSVVIYNYTLGAAAAAKAAIGTVTASYTYYAAVTDGDSNVCYLKLVYSTSDWSSEEEIEASVYTTAVGTSSTTTVSAGSITGYTAYAVTYLGVSGQ